MPNSAMILKKIFVARGSLLAGASQFLKPAAGPIDFENIVNSFWVVKHGMPWLDQLRTLEVRHELDYWINNRKIR